MKHFTKTNIFLWSQLGKIRIQFNNKINLSTEKNSQFSFTTSSATKHSPPPNVYYMEIYRSFLIKLSLIDIVQPYFIRRNKICCIILEIDYLSKKYGKKRQIQRP